MSGVVVLCVWAISDIRRNDALKLLVENSVVDPDQDWIGIQWGPWIRILNPDQDPGGQK